MTIFFQNTKQMYETSYYLDVYRSPLLGPPPSNHLHAHTDMKSMAGLHLTPEGQARISCLGSILCGTGASHMSS